MADFAGVLQAVNHGLNETNIRFYEINYVGAPANNDTITTTLSKELHEGVMPLVVGGGSYGAGALGVRLMTGAAFTIVTFDENTGILVLKNTSGGAITNPFVVVMLVAVA